MSEFNLLSEWDFKKEIVKWLLKYDRTFFRMEGYDLDDYVLQYRLPDFDYVHVDSFIDDNDDVITYLKAKISLRATGTRSCKDEELVFYHVLRTFIDSPEVEPYPIGYIIKEYKHGR
ncbi:MAG: hypothetical protein IJB16_06030 [Clostridia bacterium]|nr:hypothetical protein [Clostridia bacterium]